MKPDTDRTANQTDADCRFPDVTGLLLAGGESTRFGVDKALAVVDDTTMVQRVFDTLSKVVPVVLVSTGAEEKEYVVARIVKDVVVGRGPLAGLHAGLLACRTNWLLAVACDLPFVQSQDLDKVLAARTPDVQAVVAVDSRGRLQPLCGCYDVSVLPVVEQQLAEGWFAMHAFLDRIVHTQIPLSDASLRNVNHPEDLKY